MSFSENDLYGSDQQAEWSPVRWAFNLWTWLLILAAIAAFELFADSLLAGLVLCLKFGGADLVAGYRFRHSYARASRGTMLSYFSAGQGFLKMAFAGLVVAAGVVAAEGFWGVPFNFKKFIVGLVIVNLGLVLGTASTIAGVHQMGASNVRPWLDKTLYGRVFRWKEELHCDGKRNRVRSLIYISLITASVMLLPLLISLLVAAGANNKIEPLGVGGFFLGLWGWCVWKMWKGLRYVAKEPKECWPELHPRTLSGDNRDDSRFA